MTGAADPGRRLGHFFIDIWPDFFQNFQEPCDQEKKKEHRARTWFLSIMVHKYGNVFFTP
jgi:hypothetical protein